MSYALPKAELLLVALLLCLSGAQAATAQTRVVLADESRLWIEGSSSVNSFTCKAGTIEGAGVFTSSRPSVDGRADAEMEIPVLRFDCGKTRMNNDLYAALKAEAHALIRFRLDEAKLEAPATDTGDYRLRVTGWLNIAGTERAVETVVQVRQLPDGTYRASGSLPLLMSDFGIDPPTALLGLIKAHDRITVRFDLIATTQPFTYTTE